MIKKLKSDIKSFIDIVKSQDKGVVTILMSVAVLQTISYYYTSRRFFREYLFESFQSLPQPFLIEYIYWFIGDFITFFVLGLLIIKYILRDNLRDYGFKFGDYKTGIKYSSIFIFVMVILIWIISASPSFAEKYPHFAEAKSDWSLLFIYEMGMLIYMISWEFFWRGYMLFGLEKKFGYYSVLFQMIPFVILHNGKPFLETFGSIFGGIALGVLALRTRSFYYCVIIHIGVMISMDFISSLRYRANDYGIGINSIINLVNYLF